jgi:hypothetical protein
MRRARGGGVECPEYYPNAEILFMNLANIHSIRSIQRSKKFLSMTLEWNGIFYFFRITIVSYGTASAVTSAINVCIDAHCAQHYFRFMGVEPVCRIRILFWIRRIHYFLGLSDPGSRSDIIFTDLDLTFYYCGFEDAKKCFFVVEPLLVTGLR